MACKIKRVYDPIAEDDGYRVLVDRVWPRGLKKAEVHIDLWMKEIAPSTPLRKWFGHDPAKWQEFRKRYREELKEKKGLIDNLLDNTGNGNLTLLFSARDREHNQAVVLREHIRSRKK